MTGFTSAGTLNLLSASHFSSAPGSVAFSCTVSYGPTTSRFVTVTPPPPESSAPAADGAAFRNPQSGGGGQLRGGALTRVCVIWSSVPKTTSALSPTATSPTIGSTHAN